MWDVSKSKGRKSGPHKNTEDPLMIYFKVKWEIREKKRNSFPKEIDEKTGKQKECRLILRGTNAAEGAGTVRRWVELDQTLTCHRRLRKTAPESPPSRAAREGRGLPQRAQPDAAVPAGPRSRDSRRLYGVFLLSTLKHIHSFDLLSLGLKTFLSRKTSCWRLDTIENAGQQIYWSSCI